MRNYYLRIIFLMTMVASSAYSQRYFCRDRTEGTGCNGNWSDNDCWSTNAACPLTGSNSTTPTAADNVIINDASFSTPGAKTIVLDMAAPVNTIDFHLLDENVTLSSSGGTRTISPDNVAGGFSFRWSNTASRLTINAANITFADNAVNFIFTTPGTGVVNISGTITAGTSNAATGTFSVTGLSEKVINGDPHQIYSSFATFQGNTTIRGGFFTDRNCDFRNNVSFLASGGEFCRDNISTTGTRFFGATLITGDFTYQEPTKFYGHTTITGGFTHNSTPSLRKMYVGALGSLLFIGDKDRDTRWESGINANGPVTLRRTTGGGTFQNLSSRHTDPGTALPDTFNVPPALGVIDFGDFTAENNNTGGYAVYGNAVFVTPNTNVIVGRYSLIRFNGGFDPDGNFPCGCWSGTNSACTVTGFKPAQNVFGNFSLRPFGAVFFDQGNSTSYFDLLSYTGNNLIEFSRTSSCENYEPNYQIKNLVSSSTCATYSTLRAINPGTGNYNNPPPVSSNNATLSIPSSVNLPGTILQDITNASNNSLVGFNASIDLGGNTRAWIRRYNPFFEWNNQWNGSTTPPFVFSGAFSFTGSNTTFFWIGRANANNGWSNPNNWSISSGGPPNGSGCIPDARVDVVFDANSFTLPTQQAVLDIPFQYCKKMTWIIPSSLSGVTMFGTVLGSNLQIWDDLQFSNNMVNSFTGTTEFNSETSTTGITFNTIFSTTRDPFNFKGPIIFKNQTTEWRLLSNLTSNHIQTADKPAIFISNSLLDVSSNGLPTGGTIANITIMGGWQTSENGYFKARTGSVTLQGTLKQEVSNRSGFGNADFYNLIINNPGGVNIADNDAVFCCYDNTVYIGEGGSMRFINGLVQTESRPTVIPNGRGIVFREFARALNAAGQDLALTPTSNALTASPGGSNNSWIISDPSNHATRSGLVYKIGDEAFTFPVGTNTQYRPIKIGTPTRTGSNYFVAQYFNQPNAVGWANNATLSGGNINILSVDEYWTVQRLTLPNLNATCARRTSNVVTITFPPIISNSLTVVGLDLNPYKAGDVVNITNLANILPGAASGLYTVTSSIADQLSFVLAGADVALSCPVGVGSATVNDVVGNTFFSMIMSWKDGVTDQTDNFLTGSLWNNLKIAQQIEGGANDGRFQEITSTIATTPIPVLASGLLNSINLTADGVSFGTGKGRIFTLGRGTVTPLPLLEILNFNAIARSKDVMLKWENSANDYLSQIIQRSANGSDFADYLVDITPNKSNRIYSKLDPNPILGIAYYRLKVVKNNNEEEYSEVKAVKFDFSSKLSLFPNPVEYGKEITFTFTNNDRIAKTTITDMAGKTVFVSIGDKTSISTYALGIGLFVVKTETESGDIFYQKLSIQ